MESLKNNRVIELKKLVKKVKYIFVWCNWHEHDGDYFKAEKKHFLEILKNYESKMSIEFEYRYNPAEESIYFN